MDIFACEGDAPSPQPHYCATRARTKRGLPCNGLGEWLWSAYPPCRIYAAAEGNGAGSAGSFCRARTIAEGNGAGSARSRRRKSNLAEETTLEALVFAAGITP